MKKIILASLLMLVGSPAFCAVACDPPNTARTLIPGDDTGSTFIRVGFNPVCSTNSYIEYTDDNTNQKLIAGGVSIKGANIFAGSTLGGAVKSAGTCTANSCSTTNKATDAATGLTAAGALGT